MKNIERFLEFDGKRISILLNTGEWWIAIKPICNALGIDYIRQFKNLKEDEIISQLLSEQTTTGADGKLYKMMCLPEKFVYGWLFSINSDNAQLKAYKLECYNVLYDHFHGKMTARMNVLTEKLANIEQIQNLKSSSVAEEIRTLENRNKRLDRMLKGLDEDLLTGQISFDLKTEQP